MFAERDGIGYGPQPVRRVAVLIAAVMLVGVLAAPATAHALSKPTARAKANAKVRGFLARSDWANRATLNRCKRQSEDRIVCLGSVRGQGKTCRVRVAVAGRPPKARLRRGKCSAQKRPPSPSKTIRLGAWLGTPGRETLDPFRVTYPHGATATAQLATLGSESEPAPAPPGVLALYVDGVLECAENVNEANPEATCPVDYDSLGTYRVTTIFTSGSESAADTMLHTVDPLPTTTSLEVNFQPLPTSLSDFGCGDESACLVESGWHENGGFEIGTLTVKGNVSPSNSVPVNACLGGDTSCRSLNLGSDGTKSFVVFVIANYVALEEKELGIGETIAVETEPVTSVTVRGLSNFVEVPAADVQAGAITFKVASPSQPGYATSQATAPIQFSPAVTGQVERVACGC